MPINKKNNYLKHTGVLGMHWGIRKTEDSTIGTGTSSSKMASSVQKVMLDSRRSVAEKNAAILKINPNAAVVNYSAFKKPDPSPKQISERNQRIKNIAIGLGIGVTVAAGAILYARNKKAVDGAIGGFLQKFGSKKLDELPNSSPLSKAEKAVFEKYGIKGVKTKQDEVTANFVSSWLNHNAHRSDPISDEIYDRLDDSDVSLKPGQILKRITQNAEGKIGDNMFVSFEEDDNNRYAAFMPALWKVNARLPGKPAAYALSMEALSEIKSPSAKKRIDIFADLIKNNPSLRKEFAAGFLDDIDAAAGVSEKSPLAFAKENYHNMSTNLINRDSSMSKAYLAEVKRRGYNALIDDNDAGRLARSPLILLNSETVRKKGVNRITKSTTREVLSKIKPMSGESLDMTDIVLGRSHPPDPFFEDLGIKMPSPTDFFNRYYSAMTNP